MSFPSDLFRLQRKGTDIASAGTITPPTDGDSFDVTGTTGITTIAQGGRDPGCRLWLTFTGVLTITHSDTLELQGAADFTSAAGDTLLFQRTASGWKEVSRSTVAAPAGGDFKADGSVAMTGDLDAGGNQLANVGAPSAGTDATNKDYVDALLAAKDWKDSVRVATVVAGTLATSFENGDTVDGVALATGNRILIKNQVTQSENGIYVVNASGAPTRASDMAASSSAAGAAVSVEVGAANADKQFVCTSNVGADVVGTNDLVFAPFNGTGADIYSDGSNPFANDQSMGGFKLTDVADPTGPQDAATKVYVDDAGKVNPFVADVDGATVTFDLDDGNKHEVTLGGNRTLALANPNDKPFIIRLVQDGTGSRTVTWWSTIKWPGGIVPTLSTAAGSIDVFVFYRTSVGNYDGFAFGQEMA